jgi:hypothetical protein
MQNSSAGYLLLVCSLCLLSTRLGSMFTKGAHLQHCGLPLHSRIITDGSLQNVGHGTKHLFMPEALLASPAAPLGFCAVTGPFSQQALMFM